MARLHDRVIKLFVDGQAVPIKDGTVKVKIGGEEFAPVMGATGLLGHASKQMPSEVSFTATWLKGFNPRSIMGAGKQLRLVWALGTEMAITEAACNPFDYSDGEADLEYTYTGSAAELVKLAS